MRIVQINKIRGAILGLENYFLRKQTNTMQAALQRCKSRGMQFNTVIDVGASNGMWSGRAMSLFPEAFYYLIEAQEPHKEALINFKNNHPNSDFMLAAAGDIDGSLYFHNQDLFGGVASHDPCGEYSIRVPSVRIDTLIEQKKLKPPFLLKLDTHGFETQIFEGAKETLKKTALIVVEAYNFRLRPGALMFYEMCAFLGEQGFRCVDFCDLLYRPKDSALWQMDMFFIRNDSKEFHLNTWE